MPISISGDGSIGSLSATEIGYLDGVTSAVQTQINSKLTTPGVWTSYTPTATSTVGTITSSTNSGAYTQIGKVVIFRFETLITNQGTASNGQLILTLPVNAANAYVGTGVARETDSTGTMLQVYNPAATFIYIGTYTNAGFITTNYRIRGSFTYEAA